MDQGLLHAISMRSSGGRMLEIHKAKWFGRYTLHYIGADIVSRVTNEFRVEKNVFRKVFENALPGKSFDEEDLDTMNEIFNNKASILALQEKREEDPDEEYFVEKFTTLPKLGTRVRRGPDWSYDNQDCDGPGTIVGHGDADGTVYVQWDTGIRAIYPYGRDGLYSVVVCNEPRFSLDGLADVGCLVKRGPDWKWGDQDGGIGSIGTVYRTMDNSTVYVRWPCGQKSNYRFGYDGKFDINICDPFSPEVIQAVKEQDETKYTNFDRLKSNDLKENNNMAETSEDFDNGKESKTLNLTRRKRETDLVNLLLKDRPRFLEFDSRNRVNTLSVLQENDIETDGAYKDNVTQNDGHDLHCERQHICCSEVKTSCSSIRKSTFDIKNKHSCQKACLWTSRSEEMTSESCDEYQNDFFVKEINNTGRNNFNLPDGNVMPFSQDEISNSKHENIMRNSDERSTNTFSEIVYSNINTNADNRVWQWLDGTGAWIDYPEHLNSIINQRLHQRPNASVVLTFNKKSFRIVPHKLLQINTESKEKHKIRWKDN
ncbi:uncharacterized protein LOC111116414 isoform X5 [Crassostrea virginica]